MALCSYAAAIETIRQEGATRRLPSEVTERFFALCFTLEQLEHNSRELPIAVLQSGRNRRGQTSDATASFRPLREHPLRL